MHQRRVVGGTGQPGELDMTGEDIQGEARRLREQGPATRALLPAGVEVAVITDYGLAQRLLRLDNQSVSTDARQHWPRFEDVPDDWPLINWIAVKNAFSAYGAEHGRLRSLLTKAFAARRVGELEPTIRRIRDELLAALASEAPAVEGPVDLCTRYTEALPLLVIADLFGIPESGCDAFRSTVATMFSTSRSGAEVSAAYQQLQALLADLVSAKRAVPGEDLTTALIQARDGDERLSEDELRETLLMLVAAGWRTTAGLLDHAVVNLTTHRGQLADVLAGRVEWRDVIEETLRRDAPLASRILRVTVDDVRDEETGEFFPRGTVLVMCYAGTGRDREVYGPGADEFDVHRARKGHLSFGHGPHHCLGAPLARLEAEVALPGLFDAFPGLDLAVPAEELPRCRSFIENGFQRVPVWLGP
jgi:2-hydroxy-5-methyl-1-naphthoate 7-hydroxylase